MFDFKTAFRRPDLTAPTKEQLDAANDLVRTTLARHGLLHPGLDGDWAPPFAAPNTSEDAKREGKLSLPEGAEFRSSTFSCIHGSRHYRLYVPASAKEGLTGIIMMLHGCTQGPDDFALATDMSALAEQHRLLLVYPGQSRRANAQACWNWFSPSDQQRGAGEPALLAALAEDIRHQFDLPAGRTFVAGFSAGAAMAVVLGHAYPDMFDAIGAHSGLPFGVARDVPSAFSAMSNPAAGQAISGAALPRMILFHGTADTTVHPSNADALVRQKLSVLRHPTIETTETGEVRGRKYSRRAFFREGKPNLMEHWHIDGLGHKWSGGSPNGSYADNSGPCASAEMIRFFLETSPATD